MEHPGVGVGVYIRKGGKVLLGKRKGGHGAGEWCAPGGKMELNESPEACARRETEEETSIKLGDLTFICITDDRWPEIGTHFVTLSFVADAGEQEPVLAEPEKFEEWRWFAWDARPEPLFLSTRNFIKAGYNPFTI